MSHKAIFWDRDGILNELVSLRSDGEKNVSPQKFEDFKLRDSVGEILQKTKTAGYLNIVITNQPDIARGKMTQGELENMHSFLKKEIPTIDAIYVCPHDHSDNCQCRKPKPGLLLTAAKEYALDVRNSYIVGDSERDIKAGKTSGCKTIFLKQGYKSAPENCNFIINDLKEVHSIIKE